MSTIGAAVPSAIPSVTESPSSAAARVRLDYLDGLRGLAALYVVLHHAYMDVVWQNGLTGLPRLLVHLTNWLISGYVGVDVFIVLSGYCLMLPVARALDGGLRGGFRQFLVRRARRILPPYYAAMLFSALLLLCVPGIRYASDRWAMPDTHLTLTMILSHLLLIHNLKPDWAYSLDYPMWSVATEWQIYFLFPVLLLP